MNNEFRRKLYESFYANKTVPFIEFLNNSCYDILIEVNLTEQKYQQLYHVLGKYYVPDDNLSYNELFTIAADQIVHPDDLPIFNKLMDPKSIFDRLKSSPIPNFDFAIFRYKLQDGEYRYVEQCIITGVENGIPEGSFRIYVLDVNNYIAHQLGVVGNDDFVIAKHRDELTGLYTNDKFVKEAELFLHNNPNKEYCLINIDIQHFRFFNEWYGRKAGNVLLENIGSLLSEYEKNNNSIAGYYGHDDFVLLTPKDQVKIKALYRLIRETIISYGSSFGFLPAFGVVLIEKGMSIVDAMDRASIALSSAKHSSKERIVYYNEKLRYAQEDEYRILNSFMEAFKNDEITFYLQPQCRFSTSKIVGAEALARWVKKDGTIVSPIKFIPPLEKYGFITDLDQYLWDKVCRWLRRWIDEGHTPVPISVNVSRADIVAMNISKHFAYLTKKYKLDHKLIKIEITESLYSESAETVVKMVDDLRNDGFVVLIDDFGSGYSSLNMFSNIKVDAIKLDGKFLDLDSKGFEKGVKIIESIVHMTKQIGVPIIVEGVENKAQVDFLVSLGCRYVQGYYFYKPMPIDKFEELINDPDIIDKEGFVIKLNEQFRIREFLDANIYSDAMLNNILGPVAIYALRPDNHVDIVRFNQQFYQSVNVPDFHQRLEAIDQFLPEEDKKHLLKALKRSKGNKLAGTYSEPLRFGRIDGTYSPFKIHFYYLGNKNGNDMFYGAARNVTELMDLIEERDLIRKYSDDNVIFIRKIYEKWVYTVVSHGLSDVVGLTPIELEESMNNGSFAKRIVNKDELAEFMHKVDILTIKTEDFSKEFIIADKDNNPRRFKLNFQYVGDESTNIKYLLKTYLLD